MIRRAGIGFLLIAVLGALPACGVSPRARGARSAGQKHLEDRDYIRATAAFETAAALARRPGEKARAFLGAGRAALAGGDPRRALQLFYDARLEGVPEPVASEVNRAIGDAYFALEEYALAGRYLSKGLERAAGPAREETLARLVVCARARTSTAEAAAYRAAMASPASPEVERILAVEPRSPAAAPGGLADEDIDAEAGEPSRGTYRAPERKGTPPSPEPGARLVVHPRGSWNARAPRRNIDLMGRIDKITIHHSGDDSPHGVSVTDAAAEIQRIQRYHQNQQGWADIGYHYIIDRGGNVWQGRRLRYQGAHARGLANAGNIGIVVLGNYLHDWMTSAQVRSLETLVAKLSSHFSIPPSRVYTHREITGGTTVCPGPALTRCVHQIRDRLRQRVVAYQR